MIFADIMLNPAAVPAIADAAFQIGCLSLGALVIVYGILRLLGAVR